ncbi:hypothetical protein NDU88_001064 [Pleurodeles waltl]|uniref:Uncharacterized protein n=1 Tax=Pleurodeles waltl TaxID=8319 RepID=A0AAV7Q7H3_PLEWA|nr:hypothetical protein NDU88_001064 [Pleurodeles waltl]
MARALLPRDGEDGYPYMTHPEMFGGCLPPPTGLWLQGALSPTALWSLTPVLAAQQVIGKEAAVQLAEEQLGPHAYSSLVLSGPQICFAVTACDRLLGGTTQQLPASRQNVTKHVKSHKPNPRCTTMLKYWVVKSRSKMESSIQTRSDILELFGDDFEA